MADTKTNKQTASKKKQQDSKSSQHNMIQMLIGFYRKKGYDFVHLMSHDKCIATIVLNDTYILTSNVGIVDKSVTEPGKWSRNYSSPSIDDRYYSSYDRFSSLFTASKDGVDGDTFCEAVRHSLDSANDYLSSSTSGDIVPFTYDALFAIMQAHLRNIFPDNPMQHYPFLYLPHTSFSYWGSEYFIITKSSVFSYASMDSSADNSINIGWPYSNRGYVFQIYEPDFYNDKNDVAIRTDTITEIIPEKCPLVIRDAEVKQAANNWCCCR